MSWTAFNACQLKYKNEKCHSVKCCRFLGCRMYGFLADIDECASDPCMNSGTCSTANVNMYSCDCVAGYTGTNCETGNSYAPGWINFYTYHFHHDALMRQPTNTVSSTLSIVQWNRTEHYSSYTQMHWNFAYRSELLRRQIVCHFQYNWW